MALPGRIAYYLQLILAYSPVITGLAFLPMIGAVTATSTTASVLLLPRVGPRILIPAGLLAAAAGLAILAARLGPHSSYPTMILPALVVIGLVFACAINTATYGVAAEDAGVASALVNTTQQVGGSIGTALLNTIAASAFSSYLLAHPHGPAAQAGAAVHSYRAPAWRALPAAGRYGGRRGCGRRTIS